MKPENVKIAYIGGGSRAWARNLFADLALQRDFKGEVRLYDINSEAANDNKVVADKMNMCDNVKTKWNYAVADSLEKALDGADFVLISILPGTFDEMESDVHTPNEYGIYQSVGDTSGPGGIVRAMRTVPMFEVIAKAIEKTCPDAFVINFTNPMTWCVRTLYDVFPKIKAFGCCHEVFGTQQFLGKVVEEMLGAKDVKRHDIDVDVMGVNHFTWFTRAEYKGTDIFPLYDEYIKKHFKFYANESDNIASSAECVKMDLFRRYGQIAAAGDRHLAEFVNGNWYMKDEETVRKWGFRLTPVKWRKDDLVKRIEFTKEIVSGKREAEVKPSGEEFVLLMRAVAGIENVVSNVNLPNSGQADFAPLNAVVETNVRFTEGKITPLGGKPLNAGVRNLVTRVVSQQETVFRAVRNRDLKSVRNAFLSDALCSDLTIGQGTELFEKMVRKTAKYLSDWDLNFDFD